MTVEIGTMVRIAVQGSRNDKGEIETVPAVVTKIWPDGSLALYVFHFGGSPQNIHSIKLQDVEIVGSKPAPKMSLMDKFSITNTLTNK